MLDGSTNIAYYRMKSASYVFTPTVSGTYHLRFDVNQSGSTKTFSNIKIEEITQESKTYGGTLGTLSTPTRTGYMFVEWNSKADGSGDKITTSTAIPPSNTTYYAKWVGNNITFTCDPTTVTKGPVSVTIATNTTGYTLQYCIEEDPTVESNWKTYSQALSITKNQAVYARLFDGENAGSPATLNITNIDNEAPNPPTLTTSAKSEGYECHRAYITFTLTAGEDVGVAGTKNVTYTITGAENHSGSFETTGSIKVETAGTYTITAYTYDNVGNVSEAVTYTGKVCRDHDYLYASDLEVSRFCQYCKHCCALKEHEYKYYNTYISGRNFHISVPRCYECGFSESSNITNHSVTTKTNTVNNVTTYTYHCSTCSKEVTNLTEWWIDIE